MNDHQIHMPNTAHSPFNNCFGCVRASGNIRICLLKRSWERSPDNRAISRSGWVFLIHQLKESLHLPVLYLVLVLLLQSPFYFMGNRENLRVRLKLLRDKKHLDIHLQPLLKPAGPLLLIAHHVGCKSTESQKFSSVLIHKSVQLL